jgi:hypothetical protein
MIDRDREFSANNGAKICACRPIWRSRSIAGDPTAPTG